MFGRKHAQQSQSHAQQFRNEFGESMSALRRAAGHLAHGTAERLSPTYDRARHLAGRGMASTRETVSPMYRKMREGGMKMREGGMKMRGGGMKMREGGMGMRAMRPHKAKKEAAKRSRMRTLRRLLMTGAAVGAASAAIARRRRQQAEWAEYEPMAGFDESRYAESKYGQRSAKQKVAAGAASVADSLSDRAGRIADTLHDRSAAPPEKPSGQQHEIGTASAPGPIGPSMGSQSTPMNTGPRSQPPPSERLGDPALDFPDER